MVDGKRVSIVDENPSVAQAKAIAAQSGLIEKKLNPRKITVGEAIDRYIESKDAVLSPSTIRGYRSIQKNSVERLKNIKLDELTQEDVQRHINSLAKEKTPKYVRNVHGLLSAVISEYRRGFELHTTLPQKVKNEISIPSEEEIQKIEEAVKGTDFELPFLLATWMGLRTSEIRGLTWDCIEGDMLHIKQALVNSGDRGDVLKPPKTYSGDRKIRIPPYIKKLLDSCQRNTEYIVNCNRNSLNWHFGKICKNLGLPHYRFHDLRHVNASVMLALNVPDKYSMKRIGHATNHMLKNVYQHVMRMKDDEVADDVDNYFSKILHTNLHT